jgi:broad specificity phosphatase PhoE
LPLTERGVEQLQQVAVALKKLSLAPSELRCGPLKRTRQSAAIIGDSFGHILPRLDPRLDELDYGDWAGLSDAEVIGRFGRESFESWTLKGIRPELGGWKPSESQIMTDVRSLIAEISLVSENKVVCLVSSNGRLRYFLRIIFSEFQRLSLAGSTGMKPGHISILARYQDHWSLVVWNLNPFTL